MSRFREELRVIPRAGWVIAVLVYLLMATVMYIFVVAKGEAENWPAWGRLALVLLAPLPLGVLALLIAYVNGDAPRRGMRRALWTLVAIIVPDGIGIILYFLIRDPLLVPCPKCGFKARRRFAFCPRCGTNLAPCCPQCKRAVETDWANCAYCGTALLTSS